VLGKLLTHWALRSTLDVSAACALRPVPQTVLQKPVGYKPMLSLGSGG
jgi:hypothetical protein